MNESALFACVLSVFGLLMGKFPLMLNFLFQLLQVLPKTFLEIWFVLYSMRRSSGSTTKMLVPGGGDVTDVSGILFELEAIEGSSLLSLAIRFGEDNLFGCKSTTGACFLWEAESWVEDKEGMSVVTME